MIESFRQTETFYIPISLQPGGVNFCNFKLILFDLTEFTVSNILGLRHKVSKIYGV